MANAREEFLELAVNEENTRSVLCAKISHQATYDWDEEKAFVLKANHTLPEYLDFLQSLDFDYDCGFGSQELFGTVWFTDGTWATRGEYDGSEWWQVHECPEIPEELR